MDLWKYVVCVCFHKHEIPLGESQSFSEVPVNVLLENVRKAYDKTLHFVVINLVDWTINFEL